MLKHSLNDIFLSFAIARRYLRSNTQAFSNVGRLAFLGLVLSVSVLVIVVSVVNGFERELRDRVLGLIPTLNVAFRDGLSQPDEQKLNTMEGTWLAGSPYVRGQVLLVKQGRIVAAELTGIVPSSYKNVTQLFDYTDKKSTDVLTGKDYGLIIGAGLARQLEVEIGDDVRLVLPAAGLSAAGAIPRQRRMQVVDVLASNSLLDAQSAYVHLEVAQKLFRSRLPQGWHIRTADLFQLDAATDALYQVFGDQVRVSAWMDRYGSLYQAIAVQKLTMFFLLLFLVAVAAFNLVSGLVMIVEQRKADVAVLMTMGFKQRAVISLFTSLGLVMAVSGIALGLLMGATLATVLPVLFSFLSESLSLQLMSQYFINYLPSEVRVMDLAVIGLISIVLAALATVFPAWRATRLAPSEVLNHE